MRLEYSHTLARKFTPSSFAYYAHLCLSNICKYLSSTGNSLHNSWILLWELETWRLQLGLDTLDKWNSGSKSRYKLDTRSFAKVGGVNRKCISN